MTNTESLKTNDDMEELYTELTEYLEEHFEELGLSVLDEDYGQLEAMLNGEDTYPITFPALLIAVGEASWETFKADEQRGTMIITTRLAFDCYDDTHYGAGQREYARERIETAGKLHKLLQGLRPEAMGAGPLTRMASRTAALPKGIKVYEVDYRLKITE